MIAQDIADTSQIAQVRRAAVAFGRDLGLVGDALDRTALIVTEAGTNLMRHAREGKILVLAAPSPLEGCLQIVAVDSGPGITSVEKAMEDGFTTIRGGQSGIGTGLGALKRQSDRLDIHSDPEGTVLTATVASRRKPIDKAPATAGIIVPKPGFTVGGDAWASRRDGDTEFVMLVDVLGHGPKADAEARKALAGFDAASAASPETLEAAVSDALAIERGAAVLIIAAGPAGTPLTAVGLGNVRGEIVTAAARNGIPSSPGIAGASTRRPNPTTHDWPAGATLILTTDGLKTRQRVPEPSALLRRDALTIAAAIYQRRRRDTDDCGVVIVKARP